MSLAEDARYKIIFHLADAPAHGKIHHDSNDVYYEEGKYEEGNKDEELFTFMKELKIDYYFAKIGNHTEKMISVFKQYIRVSVAKLESVDDLKSLMLNSVSKTM